MSIKRKPYRKIQKPKLKKKQINAQTKAHKKQQEKKNNNEVFKIF